MVKWPPEAFASERAYSRATLEASEKSTGHRMRVKSTFSGAC